MIRKSFEQLLSSYLNVALKEDIRDRHTVKKRVPFDGAWVENRK